MGLIHSLEYRFEFFANILSTLFPILIQIFLWLAIYGGTGGGVMYGYSFPQMLASVAVAGAVAMFINPGVEQPVNDDIHSGGLAQFIVKPVKYIPFRLAQAAGKKFSSSVTMAIFTAAVLIILNVSIGFEIKPANILLFVVTLLLAAVLNFFIFFALSVTGFWLTEVSRFFHALQLSIMVASGGVFPITIFGEIFVSISRFLPFQYTSYFPINVMTGAIEFEQVISGILVQIVWIAVIAFVANIFWRIGLKRYVAVGG
jgi:ABC-2 type transport system permease protein